MQKRTHSLVQIIDTHITAGELLHDRTDSLANLASALRAVEHSGRPVDALVFTGDLANGGEPDAYRRLRATVDPVAERMGTPVVWGIGNHDERVAFRVGLLDGAPTDEPLDQVVDIGGLRLVMVDSTVPGAPHGELDPEQVDWLGDLLASPAPAGTVLTIHHPPLAAADPLHERAGFASRDELRRVLEGSDVRLVLSGHLHNPISGAIAGIPIWAGSATAMASDPLPTDRYRAIEGCGLTLVDLYDDGSHTTHDVRISDAATILELFYAELERQLAGHG